MKYLSEDGKIFDDETKCLEYENSKVKREQEKQERIHEVETEMSKAANHIHELLGKLFDDYPEMVNEYKFSGFNLYLPI